MEGGVGPFEILWGLGLEGHETPVNGHSGLKAQPRVDGQAQ